MEPKKKEKTDLIADGMGIKGKLRISTEAPSSGVLITLYFENKHSITQFFSLGFIYQTL